MLHRTAFLIKKKTLKILISKKHILFDREIYFEEKSHLKPKFRKEPKTRILKEPSPNFGRSQVWKNFHFLI